jgi:hypothetical protein
LRGITQRDLLSCSIELLSRRRHFCDCLEQSRSRLGSTSKPNVAAEGAVFVLLLQSPDGQYYRQRGMVLFPLCVAIFPGGSFRGVLAPVISKPKVLQSCRPLMSTVTFTALSDFLPLGSHNSVKQTYVHSNLSTSWPSSFRILLRWNSELSMANGIMVRFLLPSTGSPLPVCNSLEMEMGRGCGACTTSSLRNGHEFMISK